MIEIIDGEEWETNGYAVRLDPIVVEFRRWCDSLVDPTAFVDLVDG